MASERTEKQKVQEITEKLEQGLKELFESEKYKTYLNTMSKFHNYSFNNTMLITMQNPDATLVAGYNAWQKNFGRYVKKGEKGIRILAPAPYKMKEEQEKIDPETKEIMLDKEGNPVMEEVEITIPAFRVVSVFDVSQTDGKELPDIEVSELSGSVEDYERFMQALTAFSPVPIGFEEIEGDTKGFFHREEHRIAIKEGMSQSQTVKTAIHEVAHAMLHDREQSQDIDEVMQKDRNTKEVEVESIAYTVCQHFGVDTSDYSFGYIAGWSSGKDLKELKSSLDTIRKTASELITGIEGELQKERNREREAEQELVEMAVEVDGMDMDRVIYYRVPAARESELYGKVMELIREGESDVEIAQTLGIEYDRTWWDEDLYLLATTENYEKHELLKVRNIERSALMEALESMTDSDRDNIAAFLESKGAYTDVVATEETREFNEYHIDYMYRIDTQKVIDVKAKMEMQDRSLEPIEPTDIIVRTQGSMGSDFEIDRITNMSFAEVREILQDMALLDKNEWDGNVQEYLEQRGAKLIPIKASDGLNEEYPSFFDLEYDFDSNSVTDISDLSMMKQAENYINRLEFGKSIFSIDERNLIVNHAYKLDDMGKTKELADRLAAMKEDSPNLVAQTITNAQAEIDFLPDGLAGLSEMHEYGYSWEEMLPLTQERAAELFRDDVTVYQLYADGSETVIENMEDLQGHKGMFGIEKDDWKTYLEHRTMKNELEESSANREQISYYVIEDLSTWAENTPERSKLEHFASLSEAMKKFSEYRDKEIEYPNDNARATFGMNVGGREFDLLHERNDENCLILDFTKIEGIKENHSFLDDLQVLHNEVGFDKVRVHREMTPEEVKDFVKQRFEYQLRNSGLGDVSMYMDRFDILYEQGKMDKLMPTPNQRHIVEDVPFVEWENSYIKVTEHEPEQMAVSISEHYISIQTCEEGYDYSIFDSNYRLLDGGVYDNTPDETGRDISINTALAEIVTDLKESGQVSEIDKLISVDYDELMEKTEAAERENLKERIAEMNRGAKGKVVTLFVAECGEFHNLGEYHEGIESVDKALAIFNQISPGRMNGIPSIGINIHTEGTERYEDVELDIVSGKVADLEILDYVSDITDDPKAIEVIAELIDKLPDIEVRGSLERWQTAFLAAEIDQFSYVYDTYGYRDAVDDREAQIAKLTADIASGNVEHLQAYLRDAIEEDGLEEDVKRAQELLEKLTAYKPLVKIEELEEANYNMIDDVLNNEKPKKEEERSSGRISVKEKLAEKKAVIKQRDKNGEKTLPEKDTEKKFQREI